jgi:hypothetical protein
LKSNHYSITNKLKTTPERAFAAGKKIANEKTRKNNNKTKKTNIHKKQNKPRVKTNRKLSKTLSRTFRIK